MDTRRSNFTITLRTVEKRDHKEIGVHRTKAGRWILFNNPCRFFTKTSLKAHLDYFKGEKDNNFTHVTNKDMKKFLMTNKLWSARVKTHHIQKAIKELQ